MPKVLSIAERRERALAHAAERAQHAQTRQQQLAPMRSTDELKQLADRAQQAFDRTDTTTSEVMDWVGRTFGYRTAVACSMADAVLPVVVADHLPWVDTLFLDTGYHFAETIGTRNAVEAAHRVTIVDVRPDRSVADQDAEFGADLFSRDPGACCNMRKVQPLERILGEYEAWVTGVRRDEGPTRANTPWVTWDDSNGLVKINPLVSWTFDEVLSYAAEHDIIVNPLIADGFLSIGCKPCTRRVEAGEDPRAGRWAGFAKTECGLHT